MKKSTISRAELIAELKAQKPERSAWGRGVQAAAVEIVEEVDALEELPTDYRELNSALLNGARDWSQYSWGGCSLVYDQEIAERYCTPSELKRNHHGARRPNSYEDWMDVQTRALRNAFDRVYYAIRALETEV